jgi:hypothetical protein
VILLIFLKLPPESSKPDDTRTQKKHGGRFGGGIIANSVDKILFMPAVGIISIPHSHNYFLFKLILSDLAWPFSKGGVI